MENLIYFIIVLAIAFAFTAFSIPHIVKVSRAKNLFDTPEARKLNQTVVPTLGGIGIFIGVLLGVTIGGNGFPFFDLKYIIASMAVTFFVGIQDDLVGTTPRAKLIMICLSIFIVTILSDLQLAHMHGFLGLTSIGYIPAVLLTFFVGIVIINAFNLIDGIDGLASGLAIEISLAFGIWFWLIDLPEYALLAFATSGAAAAFFIFNVFGRTHKLFMGDTGSLLLGTIIFVLAVKFNEISATYTGQFSLNSVPAVLIGFLAYPLFDVLRVFFLRIIICKRSPFTADKNHIHHRLLSVGFTHLEATLIIVAGNATFIGASLILQNFMGVIGLTLVHISVATILSFGLEFYILYNVKLNPNDKYQTLMLPYHLVKLKQNW
jgi:UDP-GlcNAc:undecaprenyl-phosphate/decaprenyl-phosphate GlcNAc-1-phosphate transferase